MFCEEGIKKDNNRYKASWTHVTNDGIYPNQATRKQTQWTAGLSLT